MAAKVSKLNLWFKHFINESCPTTFLNRKESARKAGYAGKDDESLRVIGYQNFIKLTDKIEKWLDEAGLSDNALKIKLLSLIEAKETKFIKIKGYFNDDQLPEGSRKMGTSGFVIQDNDGKNQFSDGETLLAVNVESIETQRKTLDMAMKLKGLYAPEKYEHTGKDGGPIKVESDLTPEQLIEEMKRRGLPIPEIK